MEFKSISSIGLAANRFGLNVSVRPSHLTLDHVGLLFPIQV